MSYWEMRAVNHRTVRCTADKMDAAVEALISDLKQVAEAIAPAEAIELGDLSVVGAATMAAQGRWLVLDT